jgi:hypothetical protein
VDREDPSSDDDRVIDLPSSTRSIPTIQTSASTSLVAKARRKRREQDAEPSTDSEEDEYVRPVQPMVEDFERQWVARQQALSRNSYSSSVTVQPGFPAAQRPPSQSGYRLSRPPSARPVAVEHTLQNIQASLMTLHDRISTLERAHRLPARPPTSSIIARTLGRLFSIFSSLVQTSRPGPYAHHESTLDLVWTLWHSVRDAALLGSAILVILSWKQGRSIREVWRSWRAFLASRRRLLLQ